MATLAALIDTARSRGTELVYIRHEDGELRAGTPPWEIADEVRPSEGEPIVEKRHSDAFEATDLGEVLASRGVERVVICGMQSDFCVDSTARGAARRDYRVTVVEDGHATYASDGLSEEEIRDDINRRLREAGIDVVASSKIF